MVLVLIKVDYTLHFYDLRHVSLYLINDDSVMYTREQPVHIARAKNLSITRVLSQPTLSG